MSVRKKILKGSLLALLFGAGLSVGRITKPAQIEKDVVIQREPAKIIDVPIIIESSSPPVSENHHYYDIPLSRKLQDYLYEICEDEGIPISLVLAMIETESGFDAEIVSPTHDYGLMQINVNNFKWLEEEYRTGDMTNPYQNVYAGVRLIGRLVAKYGDFHAGLMAYNMGEMGARRLWDKGIFESKYSRKIVNLMEDYERR